MKKKIIILSIVAALSLTAGAQREMNINYGGTPKREVRAVWLTTVKSLDWPETKATSPESIKRQQKELTDILDKLQKAGVNMVLMQSRVRASTIYDSDIEPWDQNMTGTPGKYPGYDPLQFAIEQCHVRGMQIHAWVVTIPIGQWNSYAAQQLRKNRPNMLRKIGTEGFIDPENPETAPYMASICAEIVRKYDVDGIHLDYIRYPDAWKMPSNRAKCRENITRIVEAINYAVKREKPWVMLSCSPVGKHDDLRRYSSRGWNARTAVAQDAQQWLKDGLMDAEFPMIYFKGDNFYPFALDWKENSNGKIMAPGLGIYFMHPAEGQWTLTDVQRQMNYLRQIGLGHTYFRSRFFTENTKGLYDFTINYFDRFSAVVPAMSWLGKTPPTAPSNLRITYEDDKQILTWNAARSTNESPNVSYNIYASLERTVDVSDARNLVAQLVSGTSLTIDTQRPFNYAVCAIDRFGNESEPATIGNAKPGLRTPNLIKNDGRDVLLPPRPNTLDAEYIIFKSLAGVPVAMRSYDGDKIDISNLPDGFYSLHSLGKRGRTHRLGWIKKDTRK
ncbi:MAG: family 10 glycosylhydrolase [Prevotella sp.]|uniref:glycoside hydrolase family 10 protein n=1 Tax=Prevotella sp. TaxID=59823 RepID=UPI002A2AFB02|nr:family 10 glycosylhydrolase [Prevotella sp.]MDD7318175.1 family 10 glycosylhydrolase [Prevotellaceae bacterium]MDY4020936.1 family 10 glycosylhydrolase [Prevotella sp.]